MNLAIEGAVAVTTASREQSMQKAQLFTPSRRAMLIGAMVATSAPTAAAARELASTDMAFAEGTPGPGKILVWVDEQHWRALVAAASLDPPER